MKICIAFSWSLFILSFLIGSTGSSVALSKKIPNALKESIFSEIQLQNPKHYAFKNRRKRDNTCEATTLSPEVDAYSNALSEEKDHIRMKWLNGDNILMLASNQPVNSVSPITETSVWLIDATNTLSVQIQNQQSQVTQTILTLAVNPRDKSNAVLIATDLKTIFVLHGRTWSVSTFPNELSVHHRVLLIDEELEGLLFHPTNSGYLMLSFGETIYYSRDSGTEWHEGPSRVVKYRWGPSSTVFFETESESAYNPLYCTHDLFATNLEIQQHVITWYYENGVLLISKQNENDPTNKTRSIWVSTDYGTNFNLAHIPEVSTEQFYQVIAITENYAMLHLGNALSLSGQLFISDSKFTSYTLSLSDHYSQSFYQVQSIRGVYIASIPVSPGSKKVTTLITYNAGAEWTRIPYDNCPSQQPNCNLHLYVTDMLNRNVEGVQSIASAKGLILGYGVAGAHLDMADTSELQLFMSNDGGYKWEESLSTEYQLLIGNYGNLLVGVSYNSTADRPCLPISSVLLAHKQGRCWTPVKLPNKKMGKFESCGVNMEPGASSMKAFFWGVNANSTEWSFLIIDFQDALDRVCGTNDFETFTPHAATGCLFGYNETFQRVMSNSICYIGTNEAELKEHSIKPCKCNLKFDFECDFGYEKQPGPNTTCAAIPGYDVSQHCLPGDITYKVNPLGLRLIAGDLCEGASDIIKESDKFCSNWDGVNYVISFLNSHQSSSIVAGIFVLFLVFLSICLATYFVVRVWLRRDKSSEVIAYKSLLEAADNDDSSLAESEPEREKLCIQDNDDIEPLEF